MDIALGLIIGFIAGYIVGTVQGILITYFREKGKENEK